MLFRLKVALWLRVVSLMRWMLGPHLLGFVARTDQGEFLIDPEDYFVGGSLLRTGKVGGAELTRLLERIDETSRVLVVGAHIGTLALPLARKAAHVEAFEANPRTFELLRSNVALNHIENLEIFPLAASDRRQSLQFLQSRVNSGGSKRVPKTPNEMYTYDSPTLVEVEAAALDEILAPADYDLVVMDIEGSEYFALRGMPRILSRTRVLQVEFFPHHLRNVAGVSVADFLEPILAHFSRLQIPSKQLERTGAAAIQQTLEAMFQADEGDEGLLFFREFPS